MAHKTYDTFEDVMSLLRFKAAGIEMCIALRNVTKVLPIMELQMIPDAPGYFKGLMNLHGCCIPIIDFAERLGITGKAALYTIETPIILCEVMNRKVGLIVDEISGVTMVNKSKLQLHAEFQEGMHHFLAVVNEGNRPALLVNTESIIKTGFLAENTEFSLDIASLNRYLRK